MIERIKKAVLASSLVFQNEAELQWIIAQALASASIPFGREFLLDRHSRLDFFCPPIPGLAIEVKVRCAENTILRQLKRYSTFDAVRELLLICLRPVQVPATLSGKPCHCLPLYSAML